MTETASTAHVTIRKGIGIVGTAEVTVTEYSGMNAASTAVMNGTIAEATQRTKGKTTAETMEIATTKVGPTISDADALGTAPPDRRTTGIQAESEIEAAEKTALTLRRAREARKVISHR